MKIEPPRRSTDGSSDGNPPERCPRVSMQEDEKRDDLGDLNIIVVKKEVKEEEIMTPVRVKEEDVSPEISTGPAPEDWGGSLTSSDLIIASLEDLGGKDFERFKDKLSDFSYKDIRPIPRGTLENVNRVVTKNLLINFYGEAAALDVTVKVLRLISLMGPAEELQRRIEQHGAIKTKSLDKIIEVDFRKRYTTLMKERYQIHRDGNACLGETVHLDKRYTKLLIIKKQRNLKEREHEIISLGQRHLEIMDERSSSQYSPITIDRLFDPDEDGIVPKIVVLQGPAGVGKTMTSRKIILDWANGTFYQDKFHFIFYMSCRELNTLSGDISLAGLLRKLCQISCERDFLKSILGDPPKLLFLVDGFDELRWTLVSDTEVCEDPFQETSKEILLNSIFRQSCLQGASLIITTRPYSLEQLSKLFLTPRHVEILGFLGSDREQFFYGFFQTKEEAEFALSIVKDNDYLFTMCVIPITCWIVCTVIKQQMSERQREIACKTSTSIYLLYLKSLIKYHCRSSNQPLIKCVRKICTLANEGVWSQKILFGEDDLQRHELSIKDIESVFLNENIFQRDVETQTCYSFIHLTVQEFFAALYYVVGNKTKIISMASAKNAPIKKLLEEGKNKSHLELTTQFLFGLFGEKQQKETGKFLGCDQFSFKESSVMVEWLIKNHYRVSFKYLNETQDEDLIGRVMSHFPTITVVNPGHTFDYRALSYCLKNSRSEHQISFINCKIGPEKRVLLSSALHKCSSVRFSHCFILANEGDEKLPYTNSSLSGLFNSQCGIQRLQLYECTLKSYCCEDLCPVIANKSLARLSLSRNYLQDSGIKLLCKGLTDKDCVLQELSLQECGLTSNCCADLCSFITTNRTLTMLDLSKNTLDVSGLKVLCEALRHSGCTVQDLRFEACRFLPCHCEDLANIITASRSLKSINLSSNDLQDSGVKHLCQGLQHPECALQELRLMYCGLTSSCCDDLRSVLIANRTLIKLLLKGNTLGNAGIKILCDGLKHPGCTLQELRLESCGLTSYGCEDIRSVITTNRSLVKLDLTLNHLSDSGIESLYEGLGHPGCILQELLITKENLTRNLVSDLESEKPKKTFLTKWFWRSKPGNVQTVLSPKAPSK